MSRLDDYHISLNIDLQNAKFRADLAWSLISSGARGVPSRLLDVGCGTGEFLAGAASRGVREVWGVEGPRNAVDMGRSKGFQVKQVDLDIDPLPFEANYFDVATCMEVAEHLYNPIRVVKEICRVLRPGGQLILSVPNQFNLPTRLRILIGGTISSPLKVGGHIKFFRISDLRQLLATNGFDILACRGVAFPTAYRRYGPLIRILLRIQPALFATWFFVLAQKPSKETVV